MRFFAKFTAICNICFLAYVVLRFIELQQKKQGWNGELIPLPYVQNILVILGFLAIFINFVFNLLVLFGVVLKRPMKVSKGLLWFNFALLILELIYNTII